MTLVVNMFGGPGTGKSTAAYELIGKLKRNDIKAELVVEHAKWLTYFGHNKELCEQFVLLSHDYHRINTINNTVDVIVIDGSLLNTLAYSTDTLANDLAVALYRRFNNVGFSLKRRGVYHKYGRVQSYEGALDIDTKIQDMLSFLPMDECVDLQHIKPQDVAQHIYSIVLSRLNKENSNGINK